MTFVFCVTGFPLILSFAESGQLKYYLERILVTIDQALQRNLIARLRHLERRRSREQ